ncbi:DUF4102 domain-containing protein [Paraburkholderia sp. UYCP14C]|uniref:integrase arm-type DNA-binding domain-containing protein n=1 Tax=Paraburkholderia sp. UYCP14C TaxID=2511130 RepID=UPI00101F4679|nr:integrase arm-type DNA-binding domain-containing protein [Paraburkholderia sp. UYCP14C]RZF31320.1 DUF4102 domain-containing protein [Paraburkholderia sp. UYCP14C]
MATKRVRGEVGIYRITSPNDRIYIGQSVNMSQRLRGHKNKMEQGRHQNAILNHSAAKYGTSGFKFEPIFCVFDEDDLDGFEQQFMDGTPREVLMNLVAVEPVQRRINYTSDAKNYTLSVAKVDALQPKEKPYKVADGCGLFLRVSASGSKTWCYGYNFEGKRKEVTFGQYPYVGVEEAREKHLAAWRLIAEGVCPAEAKKNEKALLKR